MSKGRLGKRRKFFPVLITQERCTNPEKGELWNRYASGTLDSEEDSLFREHMCDCTFCALLVTNFKNTRKASEYYDLPPGPELDKLLTEVPLLPIPAKLKPAQREFVKRAMSWRKKKLH